MADFTLQDVMRTLEEGWGQYVKAFRTLSPDQQAAFLEKQGFDSLHDLLAHIVGWWEEGLRVITGVIDDPGFTYQEHDADEYNRELIEKFRKWGEDDLLLHFENVREATLELVAELPDDVLMNQEIRNCLYADVL